MDIGKEDLSAKNITNINIVVGKNGCGKSTYLRALVQILRPTCGVTYISPERGGTFVTEINTESNMQNNPNYAADARHQNQAGQSKNISASILKRLQSAWGARLDNDWELRQSREKTFQSEYLDTINNLLTSVRIINKLNSQGQFVILNHEGKEISSAAISSGESEIISLATEIMNFFDSVTDSKKIMLLALDEPDVHLHPDLQARLARFLAHKIEKLSDDDKARTFIMIATHSTPLICELATTKICSIATKHFGENILKFRPADSQLQLLGPFFAHPLSRSISDDPLLIIEGEDDERVWGQAGRTSNGKIKVFPCVAGDLKQLSELEKFCDKFLPALYDNPIAFSLRDGDKKSEKLQNLDCVQRFRLQCYAIENLLLTDESLDLAQLDWKGFCDLSREWIQNNKSHSSIKHLEELINSTDRLRMEKIKDLKHIIPAILKITKPWEVHLGQMLALIELPHNGKEFSKFSAIDFIGYETLKALGFPSKP